MGRLCTLVQWHLPAHLFRTGVKGTDMLLILGVLVVTIVLILAAFAFLPLWAGWLTAAVLIALLTVLPGWWRKRRVRGLDPAFELYDSEQDPKVTGSKVSGGTGMGSNVPHM